MRPIMFRIFALAMLCSTVLGAQDLTGDWQGTLHAGPQVLRNILRIAKGVGSSWDASLFSIDQGGFDNPLPASSVTLRDSVLKVTFDQIRGSYEGRISADGNTLKGTWKQNNGQLPLDFQRATKETAWRDSSPHSVRLIAVSKDVRLEVLDFGGSGRPVVLLAGLGGTAHVFDKFAPKLIQTYHVYAVTRRGFGASAHPTSGYSADRLGDDVLAVLDSLQLSRPVLVGHSIAGEELSSVGSRHPERVAGLAYLDAGYPYAYYDAAHGNYSIDLAELVRNLERLQTAMNSEDARLLARSLRETDLPAFEKSLNDFERALPAASGKSISAPPQELPSPAQAIMMGEQKYTTIHGPILAIFALPHRMPPAMANDSSARASFLAADSTARIQAEAFQRGNPAARVVRVPNADHNVFISNEADVLRELRAFIDGLPRDRQ